MQTGEVAPVALLCHYAAMQPAPSHNQHAYSVTEISAGVKRVVEDNFGYVRVRGEVGKVGVNSASGHCYLSLKDEKAVLDAVCWKGSYQKLAHKPEMGMEVIASGRITTYPGSSKYQLVIETMEPAGEGALMALLEKRKKQLAAEGLFAPERKKPIPYLPRVIGVITSPTGAVIRDILHRLSDRMPSHVWLWPVRVQGEGAAEEIARAIEGFNRMQGQRPDVIIVARGGGSIEDLWAFNEEIVVRAAAASQVPLISAVGHETDTTLIDFASDRRAPTPTAAAEMAVPVKAELMVQVTTLGARADRSVVRRLEHAREKVETLGHALPRPQAVLAVAMQRLDDWSDRLSASLPRMIEQKQQQLARAGDALKPELLRPMLQQKWHALALAHERLGERMRGVLQQKAQHIELLSRMLETMDVRAVMARGFALVRTTEGMLVTRAAEATATMRIQWVDGEVDVAAGDTPAVVAKRPTATRAPKKKPTEEQSDLF